LEEANKVTRSSRVEWKIKADRTVGTLNSLSNNRQDSFVQGLGIQIRVTLIAVFGSLAKSLNDFSNQDTDFANSKVDTTSIPFGFNEVGEFNGINTFSGGVGHGNAGLVSRTSRFT